MCMKIYKYNLERSCTRHSQIFVGKARVSYEFRMDEL